MSYFTQFGPVWALTSAIAVLVATSVQAGSDTQAKAVPSEIAPKASQALFNDLALAGEQVVAVGDKGIIMLSRDAKLWTQVKTPVNVLLNAVDFVDDKLGWAVGHDGSILHSSDGGQSWALQNWSPEDNRPFMDVLFVDDQNGFAIGAYGLFRTTQNGGKTWTDLSDPTFEAGPHLNSITRLGDGTFLIVGEMGLSATSIDGKTWTARDTGYDGSLFAGIARGDKGALVVGMRGTVLQSDDVVNEGWEKVETETQKSLFGIADVGDGSVIIGGNSGELRALSPVNGPQPIEPTEEANLSQSTAFTGLMTWNGKLIAMTDQGVKVVKSVK